MRYRIFFFLILILASAQSALGFYWQTNLRIHNAHPRFWDDDPITSVHESTHGVNAMLRRQKGGNAFYIFNGVYAWFPKVSSPTLAEVARAVRYSGGCYNLYLVRQRRYWNDNPLYLVDEWIAYSNGALVACEPENHGRQHWSELLFALEFAHYVDVMIDMLPASYSASHEVREFYIWNCCRLAGIYQRGIHRHSRQDAWYQLMMRSLNPQ